MDKSVRAFDISQESTEAMEITLTKERRRFGNLCMRFYTTLYSLWLMFFLATGKPATTYVNNFWRWLFAIAVAIDFLLNGLFLYHIVVPEPQYLYLGVPYVVARLGLVFV
jgi:hypothetical protein